MLKAMIVRLEPELIRRAKKEAIDRDTSLQALVAKALEAYLPRTITIVRDSKPQPRAKQIKVQIDRKPLATKKFVVGKGWVELDTTSKGGRS
jgi:hypothetical protein